MLFNIYILYFFLLVFIYLNLHLHLYFYVFVLRSYCNAQLKIYIDNCAIEINKIIIIILLCWCLSQGHQHGVSIQSFINLGETLFRITRE